MLGTGLGKKVDAQFVKEAYNMFLKKNGGSPVVAKKPMTKQERREECRKKGIFVVADDTEMEPTVFEKPATASRPAPIKHDVKPLKWKKTRKEKQAPTNDEKTASTEEVRASALESVKKKKKKEGTDAPPRKEADVPEQPLVTPSDHKSLSSEEPKEEAKTLPLVVKEPEEPAGEKAVEDAVALAVAVAVELKPEEVKQALTTAATPPPPPHSTSGPLGHTEALAKTPRHSGGNQSGNYTLHEPPPKGPLHILPKREKEEVFGKIYDDEFEKILEQESAKCAEQDKATVAAAKKILKTACREKAFEKVLTKEENEGLVRFFSGKIPYDQKVLYNLDRALDKTIDWMQSRNVKMSAETKELIEQRAALKKALFAEFLISPQYIPKTWAKKYEELLVQSKMETTGVNWARVLLCYPTQKSFGDGPTDQFGNFTRSKRHWLLGLLLGPSDSKTFAETQREEVCRGMYFDPQLMEKAKGQVDDDPPTSPFRKLPIGKLQ